MFEKLLDDISSCRICEEQLPFSPRPVLQAGQRARILIIGQAPGLKVQQSGIPWDDRSGDELRRWLGVSREEFYNPEIFALVPMGFCFPGTGKSGDLPPRPECAPHWHHKLLQQLPDIRLTLLIGRYAQQYYLREHFRSTLTENVRHFRDFLPRFLPLVHPSPRNILWQKRNPWFEAEVLPELQRIVRSVV